jgi:hypothetical protein
MNTNPYIYLRVLRLVDSPTTFCVEKGQKFYKSSQYYGREVAYSSGQQVKRSIIFSVLESLNEAAAPVTFNHKIEGKEINAKQAFSVCDPSYTDQLLGGWMRAASKEQKKKTGQKKGKQQEEDTETELENEPESKDSGRVIKRRSPLSISAMRPLHPLLADTNTENLTFDRTGLPATFDEKDTTNAQKIIVRNSDGKVMSAEEVRAFCDENELSVPQARLWISKTRDGKENRRTQGLFVFDVAIDLRTLFSVSIEDYENALESDIKANLVKNGWKESRNIFGKCLICPQQRREQIISALAQGLLNWRITSNQSTKFSAMPIVAVAISDNANRIPNAIRAKLVEDVSYKKAEPVIDSTISNVALFITPQVSDCVVGVHGTITALEEAEQELVRRLQAFDYEQQ